MLISYCRSVCLGPSLHSIYSHKFCAWIILPSVFLRLHIFSTGGTQMIFAFDDRMLYKKFKTIFPLWLILLLRRKRIFLLIQPNASSVLDLRSNKFKIQKPPTLDTYCFSRCQISGNGFNGLFIPINLTFHNFCGFCVVIQQFFDQIDVRQHHSTAAISLQTQFVKGVSVGAKERMNKRSEKQMVRTRLTQHAHTAHFSLTVQS